MQGLIRVIDAINEFAGRAVAWCVLAMVFIQFWVVILRYVFNIGFIPMQESIWYLHGIVFMIGAGYTLLKDGHVRIDIFYREATARTKAIVDALGVVFLLFPMILLTLYIAFPYVRNAWIVREGSTEASGLPFIYLLKTVIPVAMILLLIQGISLLLKALVTLQQPADNAGSSHDDRSTGT